MVRSKSKCPSDRIGVYKYLEDVPDRYRLSQHASAYKGRDVWEEFLTNHLFEKYNTKRFKEDVRRAGERWKDHMTEQDRHHALATPLHVEAWCKELVAQYKMRTAYNEYWVRIERFYDWLQWHTEHPHVYQPVLMAADQYDASGQIWEEKLRRGREGGE